MTPAAAILIEIEEGALARWVLLLAESFGRRPGTEVRLRILSGGEMPSALATLLSLERMVVRRDRPCGSDRIGRAELDPALLDLTSFTPDVVIDLTQADAVSDTVRLRPLYDGHPGEAALASALFYRGTPQIAVERIEPGQASGRVVAAGVASLEAAAGIGGAMEAVCSRVVTLLSKALSDDADAIAPTDLLTLREIGSRDAFMRSAAMVARAAVRAAYQLCCHPSHWRVGWRFVTPGNDVWTRRDLSGPAWNVLSDPVDHFYADPFPTHRQGRDFVFFEDLDYKTGKGVISVVAFDASGRPGPAIPVVEEPWHLSYPFLIEREGEIFMIPESSANRDIALYRAVDFPLRWERHAVLVDNVEAADATIVEHQGRLYLFAVLREGVGGYSDTLGIWWADDLLGPWRPHARNPVLVDDRMARPAGNMVLRDGALYRPVQDCRRTYGGALGIMKVTRLDPEHFAQQPDGVLSAGGPWPGNRLHTLNCNGRLEVVDGFVPRPKLKPAADMVDWWYRPKPSVTSNGG